MEEKQKTVNPEIPITRKSEDQKKIMTIISEDQKVRKPKIQNARIVEIQVTRSPKNQRCRRSKDLRTMKPDS